MQTSNQRLKKINKTTKKISKLLNNLLLDELNTFVEEYRADFINYQTSDPNNGNERGEFLLNKYKNGLGIYAKERGVEERLYSGEMIPTPVDLMNWLSNRMNK